MSEFKKSSRNNAYSRLQTCVIYRLHVSLRRVFRDFLSLPNLFSIFFAVPLFAGLWIWKGERKMDIKGGENKDICRGHRI